MAANKATKTNESMRGIVVQEKARFRVTLKIGPRVISCGWHLFKTSVGSGIRVGSSGEDFCDPVLVLVHDQFVPVYPGMDWLISTPDVGSLGSLRMRSVKEGRSRRLD
ncbi:unnamed protein product [Penicillium viridicatum]